jgi:hypothetical protein
MQMYQSIAHTLTDSALTKSAITTSPLSAGSSSCRLVTPTSIDNISSDHTITITQSRIIPGRRGHNCDTKPRGAMLATVSSYASHT